MSPATEQIQCPRNPEHGMAGKRWLPPNEREQIWPQGAEVFEIDCAFCGKSEYQLPKNIPLSPH
jgi:hypothetical protein